jgi:DNA-binding MarR family transcriptional regulator
LKKQKKLDEQYIWELTSDTNLNPIELRIYLLLSVSDEKETGVVDNLSYVKIGELIGLSESRARQVISSLVKKGYVIKQNHNIGKNNTRNVYILPKKIIQDRLEKLSEPINKRDILLNDNNNPPNEGSEKSSTDGSENPLPIDNIDNIDDDNINNKIKELKEKEGDEVVDKALKKMVKYSIGKKGFITYLIKTIDSIKSYTYSKINNFVHKKYPKKTKKVSTFNNFKQRNYAMDKLKGALLGWNDLELRDCMIE